MTPFEEDLAREAPWLERELGLRTIDASYDPRSFGDAMVVLESGVLRVRIIRERGRVFAELAALSEPEKWWDLSIILEATGGHGTEPGTELSAVVFSLRDNFAELARAFGPQWTDTKHELQRRAQRRAQLLRRQTGSGTFRSRIRRMQATPTGRLFARLLTWFLLAFIVWVFFVRSDRPGQTSSQKNTNILRVAISPDGQLTLNGMPASTQFLRDSLQRLRQQRGEVWYYRAEPRRNPRSIGLEVMKILVESRMPVRISSRADYSDGVLLMPPR